ncbi:MAG: hypothetical protein ACREPX_10435 [Rhodanobacteraceae bacterium]
MRKFVVILAVLALIGAARWALHRPIQHSPGELVSDDPVQSGPSDRAVVEYGEFRLTPLADFSVEARVLSRHDYSLGIESELAPTDFALGWRRMSDSAVIDRLDISQSARYFSYRWSVTPPIPADEIVRSSANMHLVPADDTIERELERVRTGDVVALHGRLIEARRSDGWHWRSSLRRDDTGAGACELVLVDSVEIR